MINRASHRKNAQGDGGGTLALTLTLSPGEREPPRLPLLVWRVTRDLGAAVSFATRIARPPGASALPTRSRPLSLPMKPGREKPGKRSRLRARSRPRNAVSLRGSGVKSTKFKVGGILSPGERAGVRAVVRPLPILVSRKVRCMTFSSKTRSNQHATRPRVRFYPKPLALFGHTSRLFPRCFISLTTRLSGIYHVRF